MSRLVLHTASHLPGARGHVVPPSWQLIELAGVLTELSGQGASARLTLAMRLAWEAQSLQEPVAWVMDQRGSFYPADARDNGLDLEALCVVRVPDQLGIGKAADILVRSGAFGLVVLDLDVETTFSERQLTRLVGLARKHETAILCLTPRSAASPSLGGIVALRVHAERSRSPKGGFTCALHALKDKRRAPGWRHEEVCHGPAGLR